MGTMLLGCLLLGSLPGLIELSEDAFHLVIEGHTLHATAHDGEDEQPSHGCDDCSHCMSCHGQGTPFVTACPVGLSDPLTVAEMDDYRGTEDAALEGTRYRVDRPPRT